MQTTNGEAKLPLAGMQVAVAEDETLIALDLKLTFEELGATVALAATLDQAWQVADGPLPDIAVLDVKLGAHDVYPVADRLHAAGVPIVFHSGHARLNRLEERYPSAIVLSKPAPTAQLLRAVQAASVRQIA